MPDVLIQTLLPPKVAKTVKQRAEREGLSVAAWVRRTIMMQELQTTSVRAWSRPASETFRLSMTQAWGTHPHLLLERVGAGPGAAVEFRAYNVDGTPFTPRDLVEKNLLAQNIEDGWFILDGGLTAWRVIFSMADAARGGQIVLTLVPEERHQARCYDVTPSWWPNLPANDPRRDQAELIIRGAVGPISVHITFTPGSTLTALSFTIPEGFGGMKESAALALQARLKSDLERLGSN